MNKYKRKRAFYCRLWKRTRSLQNTPSVPSCFSRPVCSIKWAVLCARAISCTGRHAIYVL